jgi:acetyltransferase-like isoleucine patch superfamily enzyme
MNRLLNIARGIRFRAWVLLTRARLRRLGAGFVCELAAAPPRALGPLRVEIDGRPGTLTLRIGRDVKIGRDCVIDLAAGRDGVIELGDRVTLQSRVRLQPWGGAIRLGDDVQLRDAAELKSSGELTIGARAPIGRNVTLHCDERIAIGRDVGLAERVTVIDSDHSHDGSDTFFMEQPVRSAPVEIGDNTFIAANAVVLRGTTVGKSCVIAAGAVLNGGDFPAGHVIAGAPAKAIKPLG